MIRATRTNGRTTKSTLLQTGALGRTLVGMKKTHAPVVTQMTSYDRDDNIVIVTPSSQAALLAELMVRVAATAPETRTLVIQCTVHRGEHDVSLPLDASRASIPTGVLVDALDAMDSNLSFLGAPVLTDDERSAVCHV